MVFHGPHGFSWSTEEAKPNFRWKKNSLKVLVTSLECQCAARALAPAVWCILPPGWLWAFWPRQPPKKKLESKFEGWRGRDQNNIKYKTTLFPTLFGHNFTSGPMAHTTIGLLQIQPRVRIWRREHNREHKREHKPQAPGPHWAPDRWHWHFC